MLCHSIFQEIQGVSYADYVANQYMAEIVLKLAIADSMTGVTSNDIYDLIVTAVGASANRKLQDTPLAGNGNSTAAEAVSLNLRSNPRPLATSDAIKTSYRVQVLFTGLTYADLSAQLVNAVSSGAFSSQLQVRAAEQGVPVLANATSSSVQTLEVIPNDDDSGGTSSSDSLPMIIGLAAGGFFILLVALVLFFFKCGRPASGNQPYELVNGSVCETC